MTSNMKPGDKAKIVQVNKECNQYLIGAIVTVCSGKHGEDESIVELPNGSLAIFKKNQLEKMNEKDKKTA